MSYEKARDHIPKALEELKIYGLDTDITLNKIITNMTTGDRRHDMYDYHEFKFLLYITIGIYRKYKGRFTYVCNDPLGYFIDKNNKISGYNKLSFRHKFRIFRSDIPNFTTLDFEKILQDYLEILDKKIDDSIFIPYENLVEMFFIEGDGIGLTSKIFILDDENKYSIE